VPAALALQAFERFDSKAAAKRNLRAAIEHVAQRLGNTPTICRTCYIHPELMGCYLKGSLMLAVEAEARAELSGEGLAALSPEEAAVLALLAERLRGKPPMPARPTTRRGGATGRKYEKRASTRS
jgi:DNA topoisomerase-1